MTKVYARLVPKLAMFERDPEKFLKRLVTVDETWVDHFESETKQESKQWKHRGSQPSILKAKSTTSTGKVMATAFWYAKIVLRVDYLKRDHTMTGNYYADLVKQLRAKIQKTRCGKLSLGVLFH